MAHRTELNEQIAQLTGISKHLVDRIGVNLNKGGLLRSGGRGRHAPDMESEDLKNIILAMLGSESSGRVFQAVLNLHTLKSTDGHSFGDILLAICSDQAKAAQVMQISILRNYPQATIYWKDESGTRIGRMQVFSAGLDQEQPGMRLVATMSGTVISALVKNLAKPEKTEPGSPMVASPI